MAAAPILRPFARAAPLSIAPCSHIPHTCCCGHRRSGDDARRCAADPERDARARDQLAAAAARHHSSGGAQRAADNARHRTDDMAAESRTDRWPRAGWPSAGWPSAGWDGTWWCRRHCAYYHPHHRVCGRRLQHAACNTPHAACNMPHAACNTPHAACNTPHAACNTPHAACNTHPSGHPCHIVPVDAESTTTGGVAPGSPCPHLHRNWLTSCHICTGTGLTPANICFGACCGMLCRVCCIRAAHSPCCIR
jgi:hypothetical protein